MRKRTSFRTRVSILIVLFFAAVFSVPALRHGDIRLWIMTATVPVLILAVLLIPSRVFFLDRPSLSAAFAICGFGIMAPVMLDVDAVYSQAFRCAVALIFLFIGAALVRSFRPSFPAASVIAVISLGMLSFPVLISGDLSVSEPALALLFFSVAAFLSLRMYLPSLGAALAGLLLLLLQRDTGTAVIWGASCVLVFFAASGSGLWSGISFVSLGALLGVYVVLFPDMSECLSSPLLSRLAALPLIVSEIISESAPPFSDLFFLLGEQYGSLMLLNALLLLSLILLRAASLAVNTRKAFHASLTFGVVLLIGLRSLIFMLTLADLAPFPMENLPFLTVSLPRLCADFLLLGFLSGVSAQNENDLKEDARLSMLAR